ncbi:hypothetical protein [Aurantimonas sp. VKM B-3413]|uniref:hypothetical protein n=1 Tax=Aurantimonas sp. VKM B-3413 TaxID=2779401 RepID=UPI001E3AF9A6|nr:hypothetical protein [Aurantimonas sp. VKM B-3413]MCB8839842.1 hypothetical protein [Aurantimonas sp. VKM B-3413]
MADDLRLALDRLADGDWDAAHAIVQDDPSADAAWIHAHLHRVEGDPGNAAYWYRRAGRPPATGTLDEEFAEIRRALGGTQAS